MAKKFVNASKNAGFKTNRITKRPVTTFVNASKRDEDKNQGGILGGAGYLLGNLGLGLAGVGEGVSDILSAGGDLLRGDTEMAKYRFKDNKTSEAREKLEKDYNPGAIMKLAGDVSSGIGNSLTFMIPYVGPYLAGAGYVGMGISDAAAKTGDVGAKELAYGAVSGALEFGLDAITGGAGKAAKNLGASITRKLGREAAQAGAKATGKLAGKSFGKSVLVESLKGAGGEALEESLSELIDPQLQKLFGIDKNAETSLKNVAYAGLIGAISGGLMTAGPAAINYKNAASVGKKIRESGETEDFIQYTNDVLKAAQRTQTKYATAAENAKDPADASVVQKFNAALNPLSAKNKSNRAKKRVEAIADTVQKNLNTLQQYRQNPTKTTKELEIADAVLGELRGNVFLLENASLLEYYEDAILDLSDEDKQSFVDEVNRRAKNSEAKKSDYTVEDLNNNTDDILTSVAAWRIDEDQYGDLFTKARKATRTAETTAQPAQEAAQATEGGKAEEAPAQPANAVKKRFVGNGEVRIAGGKQVKDLNLSDEQYTAYKAAEILAPTTGADIELHESLDKDGKTANGYYDPSTNTFHININAKRGTSGKQIALYTLGHETTHYIREWSPAKYEELASFVMDKLGGNTESLVSSKADFLRTISDYQNKTDAEIMELAREEVVADGMELILTDGKVLDELARTDRTLWETIREWIEDTIAKIREAFANLNQASKTAQTLKETLDSLEEVERLFTEGVKDAGEQTRKARAEIAEDTNGKKYSVDEESAESPDVSENRIDEYIDETQLANTIFSGVAQIWSEADSVILNDHATLAQALYGTAQNEQEYRTIKRYEEKAEDIAGMEARLAELRKKTATVNKEINSLQSKLRGVDKTKREPWVMTALTEATGRKSELLKEINAMSSKLQAETDRLLSLRATAPIRRALNEANKRADAMERKAEKAEQRSQDYKTKVDEKAKQSVERKEITIRKRATMRILGQINTMLYHPTKTKHVPAELQELAQTILRSVNPKDFEKNRNNLREMGELAAKIEQDERKVAKTAKEQETMEKRKSKYENLEAETLSTKRQAEVLLKAFEDYQKKASEGSAFDQALIDSMSDAVDKIEEVPMTEMGLKSLEAVERFCTLLKHQIDNANKTFATEKALDIDELGRNAATETQETKPLKVLSPKGMEIAAFERVRKYFWKNMKPLTVFEAIGSKTFMDLFQNVLNGEDVWARDIVEAKEKIQDVREKYKYKDWDLDERRAVKTKDGTVNLSLSEIMSLYAYSFRKQAVSHLEGGGFILDANATTKAKGEKLSMVALERRLNDSKRYVLDEILMGELAEMLTSEQKEYVREMQKYLTSLGEKGNTVSRKLYGIDIFTESDYFPIKVKSEYLKSQTGKSGDPNIKNRGMTKEVIPEAKDPLVLQGFDEILVDHINSMATYHAFVLPIEDLTRVLNYKPMNVKRDNDGNPILDENGMPVADDKSETDYSTLKAVIESKYGATANEYIVQLIRDLNGGARRDAAAGIIDQGITAFKRASTMASLSVLVQQPTSLFRAMAYMDAKYLFGNASIVDFSHHKELWERVKKYAPVAIIKEMGGYDTGVGARTGDYLNDATYEKGERVKGFLTDSNYRSEVFGIGAAYADEMAWIQLFEACVSEQADKLREDRNSEKVLRAAGKRFEEVVRRTQVYDSTLTRSEYMRSKDTGAKMATAFMAEPTTIVSMVTDALIKAERGDAKFLRNTAAAVAMSVIVNALAASLVYAMRDDDKDETYKEKYIASAAMETADAFNPFGYFPIARDIVSIMQGYEIERSDMTLISNLVDQVEMITSSKRSVTDKVAGVSGAVSAFFGIPVTNVYRDAKGALNTILGQVDTEKTTNAGISAAVKKEFTTIFGLFDDKTKNAYQLYQATIKGDESHLNRVKSRYESPQAAELALRQALRDNDPRIAEAAQARISGELDVYESIVEQIEQEGVFDRNIVIRAVNNEINAINNDTKTTTVPKAEDEEEDAPEQLYKSSDLNAALERGDEDDFLDVYASLLSYKMDAGKTEAQARSAVKSSITAYWKKRYLAAWEANDTKEIKRIQAILLSTGLYGTRNEVAQTGQDWIKAYAESQNKTKAGR